MNEFLNEELMKMIQDNFFATQRDSIARLFLGRRDDNPRGAFIYSTEGRDFAEEVYLAMDWPTELPKYFQL